MEEKASKFETLFKTEGTQNTKFISFSFTYSINLTGLEGLEKIKRVMKYVREEEIKLILELEISSAEVDKKPNRL